MFGRPAAGNHWLTPVLALCCLVAATASPAHAARDGASPAAIFSFLIAADQWPALGDLEPDRQAFVPPAGGGFNPLGFGARVQYLHRVRRAPGMDAYLGGEFSGYAHFAGERFAGTDAGSGQPVHASLYVNVGDIALCGRLSSRPSGALGWHMSAGIGVYMVVVKDQIDGVGIVESETRDESLGAHFGLGLFRRVGHGPIRIELESRVQTFEFHDLRPGFPAASAPGPLIEVAAGVAWEL